MAEKTELEIAEEVAKLSASNALVQALYSTSRTNADVAVHYISQHAIALMKLAAEREHVVLKQTASGGLGFVGFAPNASKPKYSERDAAMFARGMQMQYVASHPSIVPLWEQISVVERNDWTRRAHHFLGVPFPGEPR